MVNATQLLFSRIKVVVYQRLILRIRSIYNDYRVPYSAIRSGFAYFGKDISDEDITCLINSLVAARLLKCYTSHNHKTVVFSKKECSVCWDS